MKAAVGLLGACVLSVAAASPALDSATVSGIGARNIGSAAMSGRIAAVAGRVEADGKVTLFVGAASGGVWKSVDGGTTFKSVFDKQGVQSIGAVAFDPSDPKVVWVGTGESWTRNSVSVGNGIWRSGDGGETWTHMGLPESERVNRIVVHPSRSDVVYACVPGKLWSDSPDRGLYKTVDGGHNWTLVLPGPNLSTGCSGLAMDPRNPDRLFAGLWDFRRKGWTFRSGSDGPQFAEMPIADYLRMARVFVSLGITKVRLTGGEPLLRKGVVEFVRELAALRTLSGGKLDIALTTNGHLLADMAQPLKDAGLTRVTVAGAP